jgi:hypothetical protein
MTKHGQNIFCGAAFSLYIRGSPHQARESFRTRAERVFCRPVPLLRGALLVKENAYY